MSWPKDEAAIENHLRLVIEDTQLDLEAKKPDALTFRETYSQDPDEEPDKNPDQEPDNSPPSGLAP